jgi:glutathione S-transferase
MLKVLGRKTSGNVQKVLFMLEEAGIAYDREDYGRQFENTQTAEYKAMNPTSKVPTLVDGDTVIWESNTILRYLAATRAEQLTGATPAERTEVERWMDFLLAAINHGYLTGFKAVKLDAAERPAGFDAQIAELHSQMAIVSDAVEGKEFIALGRLTIADIALAPILGRCLNFPYDRPAMPGLEAWFEGISGRPAFKAATG